jgi:hypothetical protein
MPRPATAEGSLVPESGSAAEKHGGKRNQRPHNFGEFSLGRPLGARVEWKCRDTFLILMMEKPSTLTKLALNYPT